MTMSNYKSNIPEFKDRLKQAELTALKRIGMFGQAESVLRCPVDSGRLRQSIQNQVNESENSVAIGSNVSYAAYVHEGTSRQPPQPFIRKSITQNISAINNIVKSELGKVGS